jgi:chromosome segregation ATPase
MRSSEERRDRDGRDVTPGSDEYSDDASSIEAEGNHGSPPKSQYEELRDKNFRHLQNEDADEKMASQMIRHRSQVNRGNTESENDGDGLQNVAAENGIIESITCVQFMCHERLHCELGPLLNFIIGRNGSGKSAVLTALTLCLGGKASSTSRGGSLKSFIREGQERAILSVKIKNQGADSYKHDIYGDSIIVERHFSRAGASSFKIKSATGQLVSTKKLEVDEITEYYCLQVDNPLNVLSQDQARHFLNASSASQKYKFFIEGVQLEQLDRDYRLVSEYLDSSEEKIPIQEEKVEKAKNDHQRAMRLFEDAKESKQAHRRLRDLTAKLAWAVVADNEKVLEEKQRAVENCEAQIQASEQESDDKSRKLEELDAKITEAEKAVHQLEDNLSGHVRDLEDKQKAYDEANDRHRSFLVDERHAHGLLDTATKQIKKLETEIEVETQRLEESNGGAVAKLENDRQAQEEEQLELRRQNDECKASRAALEDQITAAKQSHSEAVREETKKRDEVKACEEKIRRLESGQRSPYDGYENGVARLVHQIQSEHRFQHKPLGPIGNLIRLQQARWSTILEVTLGGTLNSFIVTSTHDHKILQEMMRQLNIKRCPIILCNRDRLDTTGKEPDARFDTIMRVLQFEDQLVRDQLIISNAIEQIILIPNRIEAQEVMFNSAVPRNVQACLTFHDGNSSQGLRLTNRGGTNLSSAPVIANRNLRHRIKTDSSIQVAMEKEVLERLKGELRNLERESRVRQQETQRLETQIRQRVAETKRLDRLIIQANVRIRNIEVELSSFEGIDSRLQGLNDQLREKRSDMETYGRQYGDVVLAKNKQKEEVKQRQEELDVEKKRKKTLDARIAKESERPKRLEALRRVVLREKNNAHEAVEKLKRDKEVAEEERDEQAAALEVMMGQARQCHAERLVLGRNETSDSINETYMSVKRIVEQADKKRGMTAAEVLELAKKSKEVHDQAVKDLRAIRTVNRSLKHTLNKRLDKWRIFQRYITAHARANFIYLLTDRAFRGKLQIDHRQKRLAIKVEPDPAAQRTAGRNTKTLSGGEKSYSSICLLLSIWEAMGSPIRCLDEFDVFMDNINRAISTNLLVYYAFSGHDSPMLTRKSFRLMLLAAPSVDNTFSLPLMP